MTKKEFRALWAVPIDIDARRRRIERMQAMLDDAPMVVDTVQASSDAPAYGMHTVKITGIDTAGRAEKRTVLAKLQADMQQRNKQYRADYAQAVELIEGIEERMPQAIAERILSEVYFYDEKIADDMTVLVTGIWRIRNGE